MLLVQLVWTIREIFLLIQKEISWKMAEVLWITFVITTLEKWLLSGSIITLLISHQTLLELSQFGSWKDDEERRRWEKTLHVLKSFNIIIKAWEVVSTWQTCCYHCIKYRVRKSGGMKRYSGVSLIWERSVLGCYAAITFVRMENQIVIRNLLPNSVLSYQML